MNTRLIACAALAVVLGFIGFIGTQAVGLEFEVASIKPTKSPLGVTGGCHGRDARFALDDPQSAVPLGRCVITAGRLSHLMSIAYEFDVNRIDGRPEWDGPSRFDVEAKAEDSTATQQQLLRMLQALLEDRFRLKAVRETRQQSGYALVIGKNGPKFKEASAAEESRVILHGARISKADAIDGKNPNLNTAEGKKASIAQLVQILFRAADGPVVDRTGLTGYYDFTLSWEPGEDMSSVLQEQLGLRLEAQKVPVEFMTITSAEKPSEN